jgi:hypothetical protein
MILTSMKLGEDVKNPSEYYSYFGPRSVGFKNNDIDESS